VKICGVKTPKSRIQIIREKDAKANSISQPLSHPIIERIQQANKFPSSQNPSGLLSPMSNIRSVSQAPTPKIKGQINQEKKVSQVQSPILIENLEEDFQRDNLEDSKKVSEICSTEFNSSFNRNLSLNNTSKLQGGGATLTSPFSPLGSNLNPPTSMTAPRRTLSSADPNSCGASQKSRSMLGFNFGSSVPKKRAKEPTIVTLEMIENEEKEIFAAD